MLNVFEQKSFPGVPKLEEDEAAFYRGLCNSIGDKLDVKVHCLLSVLIFIIIYFRMWKPIGHLEVAFHPACTMSSSIIVRYSHIGTITAECRWTKRESSSASFLWITYLTTDGLAITLMIIQPSRYSIAGHLNWKGFVKPNNFEISPLMLKLFLFNSINAEDQDRRRPTCWFAQLFSF